MIKIHWNNGKTCNDATIYYENCEFEVNPTLGEFIDWLLNVQNGEWGYIALDRVFNRRLEYRWGKIVSDSFTPAEKAKKIALISADGGWTRMDYTIRFV